MKLLSILRKPIRYSFYHITFWLIGINVVLYFLTYINPDLFNILKLAPQVTISKGYFWQVFTYMFLHSTQSITHILFNMFGLFIFGYPLEKKLGSLEFLFLYLFTGIATGLFYLFLGIKIPVVGASGAIYGLLLGYAVFYPDATLLFGFFIPIKARIAVIIFTVLSLILHFTAPRSGVAHIAHLAGVVFSFFYFIVRLDINPIKVLFNKN